MCGKLHVLCPGPAGAPWIKTPVFLLLSQEPLGVDTLFGEKVFELNLGVGHFAMGRIPHSQRMQVL